MPLKAHEFEHQRTRDCAKLGYIRVRLYYLNSSFLGIVAPIGNDVETRILDVM